MAPHPLLPKVKMSSLISSSSYRKKYSSRYAMGLGRYYPSGDVRVELVVVDELIWDCVRARRNILEIICYRGTWFTLRCEHEDIKKSKRRAIITVELVFKGPVQSGFFAPFGRTATATGCLLW
jgi:hypothetical protein